MRYQSELSEDTSDLFGVWLWLNIEQSVVHYVLIRVIRKNNCKGYTSGLQTFSTQEPTEIESAFEEYLELDSVFVEPVA
ncbi:hypothetical protein TNCV_4788461 [Trichonephila clavipes]|nr:hypothetical protein TNCV_4788461 [Trichonephila clavipes]